MVWKSESKKELKHGSNDRDKDASAKPGGGGLLGVVMAAQHFDIHMDSTREANDRGDRIHQLGPGCKITADEGIGLVDAGISVSVLGGGGGGKKQGDEE